MSNAGAGGLACRRAATRPKAKDKPAPQRRQAVKVVVPINDKLLLTVEEFAAMIGLGRTQTYRLVMEGHVRSVMLGRLRRVPRHAAEEYVNSLPAA